MILLDTCALLWWSLDPDQLSVAAKDACLQMERDGGFVSSISIWEIGVKIKRKKLEIGISIDDFVIRLRQGNIVEILSIDAETWLENLGLVWDNNDPADRTIVATARLRGLSIVTADEAMRAVHRQAIW